ncbi:MAG: hypothetical protein HC897_07345, partial [Thermoanaerobaculia bacterium]|nr:hypothetical protein [Thermoanaerobaculia bacterium]
PPGSARGGSPRHRWFPRPAANLRGLRLRIGVHPVYLGQYAELWRLLRTALTELGIELEEDDQLLFAGASGLGEAKRRDEPTPDLAAMRWIADYPDVDGFVSHLLGSKTRRYPELASSDEVEQLTTRGRHETDPSLRHAIYRQIEETIARDRLLLPLFHEQTYRFQQPQMRGLHLGVTIPEIRYEELYLAA